MKRIFFLALASLATTIPALAQGEIDAIRYSRNDLTGTARSVGMGGAFGALGGDISGIAINPAGIGVYKSSEIVGTISFNNTTAETNLNAGKTTQDKFLFDFDNFGIVGAFPMDNDEVPFLNFGFTYNKLKSFDRKYEMKGNDLQNSLTDYMAVRATHGGNIVNNTDFSNGADWLGTIGFQGGLIGGNSNDGFSSLFGDKKNVSNYLYVKEKGEISSYDFNAGTTFSDMLSLGVSFSVADVRSDIYSTYDETAVNDDYFILENVRETRGAGFQMAAGVIFKPIHEFRIGAAYHSPTWYNFEERNFADLYVSKSDKLIRTPEEFYEYDFRTPDRWTLSMAGVIGQTAIISADYELTNYKDNMKFRNVEDDRTGMLAEQNDYIKQDFKNASTVRVGAEIRITPQFSARAGYAWMQTPFDTNFTDNKTEAVIPGTAPHYVVEGDANHFTYGLGYRFNRNFYADVAFVMKNQKNDLYAFPKTLTKDGVLITDNDKIEYKLNTFSGLITLGYKF